jgi:hypothetical protein
VVVGPCGCGLPDWFLAESKNSCAAGPESYREALVSGGKVPGANTAPTAHPAEASPVTSSVAGSGSPPAPPARPMSAVALPAPSPGVTPKFTSAELVRFILKEPIIDVCPLMQGRMQKIFKHMLKSPEFMHTMIKYRPGISVGLLSYRLPINQALAFRLDEKPSLINDVSFAYENYRARRELEKYLPLARQVETQSYFAATLQKIVEKNPSLLDNPKLNDLCEQLTNTAHPLSQNEMVEELRGFMQMAQVKPEEINFNADYQPSVRLIEKAGGYWEYTVPNERLQ